jgi:hypothetical protein
MQCSAVEGLHRSNCWLPKVVGALLLGQKMHRRKLDSYFLFTICGPMTLIQLTFDIKENNITTFTIYQQPKDFCHVKMCNLAEA